MKILNMFEIRTQNYREEVGFDRVGENTVALLGLLSMICVQ